MAFEFAFSAQFFDGCPNFGCVEFYEGAAFVANHVLVLGVAEGVFVVGMDVGVADGSHQVGLGHEGEGSVDGPAAYAVRSQGEFGGQFVGAEMVVTGHDGAAHAPAGGGDAVAARLEKRYESLPRHLGGFVRIAGPSAPRRRLC